MVQEATDEMVIGTGVILFLVIGVVVVIIGMRQMNRPKCPSCGLSVDADLDTCPYCHATMR